MKIRRIVLLIACFAIMRPAWTLQDSDKPEDWFNAARADLEVAELVMKETPHYGHVCFLAHQAVEKSLKGALLASGVTPEKGHLNARFLTELARYRPELQGFGSEARSLDGMYVPSRYPKLGFPKFTKERATQCLEKAKQISQAVTTKPQTALQH